MESNIKEKYKNLYKRAADVLKNAYAPYSGFSVGAAVLVSDGSVFTGVNVENSSYGSTICAERSAISAAITEGKREFEAIAIASSGGAAYPCGICRQVIFEFGNDIKIITGDNSESLEVNEIQDLLPKGFRL